MTYDIEHPDFDPRDYTIWAECEVCEQTANVTHIDDQWQCDHCIKQEIDA